MRWWRNMSSPRCRIRKRTLDDFIRVLKPGGELILVNHIGAESGPRRIFELAFAPLARRLGWRPEFPWERLTNWAAKHGGVTLTERRPMPPMGHFSLIRYPQIVKQRSSTRREAHLTAEPPRAQAVFSCMAMKRALLLSCVLMAAAGVAGAQAPPASGHAAGPDRAAIARTRRQLRADAADAAFRRGGAGRHHHRPAGRAARRQTGPIRRRAVPARRRRSRNARADAGRRQDAGDSAARQPRRRPDDPAEIAPFCRHLAGRARLCLTGPRPTPYMPRVRDCGILSRDGEPWRGSSAG